MENNTFIYALCDPNTLMVRYVGKANNVKKRFYNHLDDKSETYKTNWLKKLRRQGKLPVIRILEKVNINLWEKAEIKWIKKYRKLSGLKLTNTGEGGEGVTHTPEVRKKMSEKSKGRIVKAESRIKISEAIKKQWANPELRKKFLKSRIGLKVKGHKLSLETRQKLSAATKRLWANSVYRDKRNKKFMKTVNTTEYRKKRSDIAKKFWKINPELRKKYSEFAKKQWKDSKFRAIRAQAVKKQWANPEHRKNRALMTKILWTNPEYRKKVAQKKELTRKNKQQIKRRHKNENC